MPTRLAQPWHVHAACKRANPDDFTPAGPDSRRQESRAKTVCFDCPVREVCLDDAYASGDDHTIRGGLTADERREMNPITPRRSAISRAHGTATGVALHEARHERLCGACARSRTIARRQVHQ